jgi:pantoate--beta-alanine ligase
VADSFEIVRTIEALRARVRAWQHDGHRVGLVPTMGGLHAGHLALVQASRKQTDKTVATLFVNPKQFGPSEDFESYPRDEERDVKLFTDEGTHLLFVPPAGEMYPDGFSTSVSVANIGGILEGEYRPGFFTGVATVVTKLLLQAGADQAFFGEKDYQQLQVIKRLVTDLNIPVEISGVATVRENDGLALSSRNQYLTPQERGTAPALYKTITDVAEKIKHGENVSNAEVWGSETLIAAGFESVDYVSARDAHTLEPLVDPRKTGRVLAAAKLGKARLIDNVPIADPI